MTNLTFLDLSNAQLTDISGLANMTQLQVLYLDHNNINNIDPLVTAHTNGSFQPGGYINLRFNPLGDPGVATDISALQGAGNFVDYGRF